MGSNPISDTIYARKIYNSRDDNKMKIYEDEHVGEKIGIYEILYLNDYKSNSGHKIYHIQCIECGWENDIRYKDIKALSKVCKHLTIAGSYVNFNGRRQWKNKRLKRIFENMCLRCYGKGSKDYKWYGEKGIRIYQDWIDNPSLFEEWALNNGYKDNLTIDRIDADKNYCPDNCQWIMLEENTRKAGKVNWIVVNGEKLTGRQWAKRLNLGPNTINTVVREYGFDTVKKLISKIIDNPELVKSRKPRQSILSVYDIQIDC